MTSAWQIRPGSIRRPAGKLFPTFRTVVALAALLSACEADAPTSPTALDDPSLQPSDSIDAALAAAGEGWDRVLANVELKGDVVVPAGEVWLIGPRVRIRGNLRTEAGTIAMRPGSSLHFVGADPRRYVGGGMGYEPRFAKDYGLWIGRNGVLDIRGTPKTGWNRSGSDPTWQKKDELWISPTRWWDFRPRRWRGGAISPIHPLVPAAEVMNVTRDVLIEGPGHIHIHSTRPQRIEYVTLRRMGVSNARSNGPVEGRYALHFHHGGNGTRGSIVRGVAALDSRGRVFVPHGSHGITFTDNVSVNSYAEAFWWDVGHRTNEVLIDRLAVSGVHMPRTVSRRTSQHSAVVLGGGVDLEIRNSVVSGARGSSISHGFDWPSKADNDGPAIWKFDEGNVAHNSQGSGIRLWFNNPDAHLVANAITYRHGIAGIENGAYRNSHRYDGNILVDDRVLQHASSQPQRGDGGPSRFSKLTVIAGNGPAILTGRMNLAPLGRTEFVDCDLRPGPGFTKVLVISKGVGNPFLATFRRCGMTPADVDFQWPLTRVHEGTSIIIDNEDGSAWEITADVRRQRKVVRPLRGGRGD